MVASAAGGWPRPGRLGQPRGESKLSEQKRQIRRSKLNALKRQANGNRERGAKEHFIIIDTLY